MIVCSFICDTEIRGKNHVSHLLNISQGSYDYGGIRTNNKKEIGSKLVEQSNLKKPSYFKDIHWYEVLF